MEKIADHRGAPQGPEGASLTAAKAVRNLRKSLGLTQIQLARKLFVQQNSVSRYELGTIRPSPQVLFILMMLAHENGEQRAFADALARAGIELASAPPCTSTAPVSVKTDQAAISKPLERSDA